MFASSKPPSVGVSTSDESVEVLVELRGNRGLSGKDVEVKYLNHHHSQKEMVRILTSYTCLDKRIYPSLCAFKASTYLPS